MPYPGGKHAPGHYLSAGGNGSFSSAPFVFRDSVMESTNNLNLQIFVRFLIGLNPNDGELHWRGPAGLSSGEQFPGLPLQYWEGVVGTPPEVYAARRTVDSGPDPIVDGDLEPLGIWTSVSLARARLIAAAASSTVENTSTYELSKASDTSVVLARAEITLRYIRT